MPLYFAESNTVSSINLIASFCSFPRTWNIVTNNTRSVYTALFSIMNYTITNEITQNNFVYISIGLPRKIKYWVLISNTEIELASNVTLVFEPTVLTWYAFVLIWSVIQTGVRCGFLLKTPWALFGGTRSHHSRTNTSVLGNHRGLKFPFLRTRIQSITQSDYSIYHRKSHSKVTFYVIESIDMN